MKIENQLKELGLELPHVQIHMQELKLPFRKAKIVGNMIYVSGHVGINTDGSISELKGRVGEDVTQEQAKEYAKMVALGMLSSIKNEIEDLDRIKNWVKVTGFVNSATNFYQHPFVINGFSEFINELFGTTIGEHTRSAIGVASLPFNCPVEIEAQLIFE